ncbi:MAG: energy-coupled thiamine transporter ThiT [Clostridia bacterium]
MSYLQSVFKDFAEISTPTIIALAILLVVALVFYISSRKRAWNARMLVYGALCIAIAFTLSYVRIVRFPQGGSITPASMLPVMAFAFMFGPAPGLLAGTVYGLLQLLQDFYVVHPVQLIIDYILAFGALGLAGFFRKNFILGVFTGGFVRLLCHFVSGMVFFAEYAPPGQPAAIYSLIYNISVIGPDILICLAVAMLPQVKNMMKRLQDSAQ